jgi:hypothetical protein
VADELDLGGMAGRAPFSFSGGLEDPAGAQRCGGHLTVVQGRLQLATFLR